MIPTYKKRSMATQIPSRKEALEESREILSRADKLQKRAIWIMAISIICTLFNIGYLIGLFTH